MNVAEYTYQEIGVTGRNSDCLKLFPLKLEAKSTYNLAAANISSRKEPLVK